MCKLFLTLLFSADWTQIVAISVSILSLFVASLSVVIGHFSHRLAKKAAQAQLIAPFLNEYASNEMLDALKTLKEWKKSDHNLLKDLGGLRSQCKPIIEKLAPKAEAALQDGNLDNARRLVNLYFKNAYILWKYRLIDKKTLRCIIDKEAYHGLFFDVVTTLTLAVGFVRIHEKNAEKFIKSLDKDRWQENLKKLHPPRDAE